jgi:predicted lipid-binding transport protein (Tim44 family)
MGDNLQILEIIVFGLVAAFLLFRLRGVLGRRTGNERPRAFRAFRTPPSQGPVGAGPVIEGNVVPFGGGDAAALSGAERLKATDRNFDEAKFLAGARGAFEIIVNAFAAGDAVALRPLLSDEVYQSFAKAIGDRNAARETQETNLLTVKTCEIAGIDLVGREASVTVKFVSDQINVTRAADGKVVEGDPDHVAEKTDIWTFGRDVQSRDPNWKLTGTKSV